MAERRKGSRALQTHIAIVGFSDPIDRQAALAKARAAAIVRFVPAIGVARVDGANLDHRFRNSNHIKPPYRA
jgi:hypothetical protein